MRILPVGSHDRRDMQIVGRRLVEVTTPDGDLDETLKQVMADSAWRANGRLLHLFDLDDLAREAIERSIASDID